MKRLTLKEQSRKDKEDWANLYKLAKDPDIRPFYKAYAKYLEENGIISKRRALLHHMAKRAANET